MESTSAATSGCVLLRGPVCSCSARSEPWQVHSEVCRCFRKSQTLYEQVKAHAQSIVLLPHERAAGFHVAMDSLGQTHAAF